MGTTPPITPPALSGTSDAMLLARIAALESRMASLERVLAVTASSVTLSSPGTLSIQSNGTLSVDVRGQLAVVARESSSIDAKKALAVTVGKDLTVVAQDDLQLTGGDGAQLKCGSAYLDLSKNGDLLMHGNKVTAKATGDIQLKGSKILQN